MTRCQNISNQAKIWRRDQTGYGHFHGLVEIWVGNIRKYTPIHKTVEKLPSVELVETLPGIHALTGCDTASKVGTKQEEGNKCYDERGTPTTEKLRNLRSRRRDGNCC